MEFIVLHTEFKCKPGTVQGYVADMMREVACHAQQEEGNMQYEFTISCERPDTAILLEKWTNRDAFAKHATMPYVQPEFMKQIEQGRVLDVKGEWFE